MGMDVTMHKYAHLSLEASCCCDYTFSMLKQNMMNAKSTHPYPKRELRIPAKSQVHVERGALWSHHRTVCLGKIALVLLC